MITTETQTGLWLSQFEPESDLELATKLLSKFKLVTYSQLSQTLLTALGQLAEQEQIGVFIEREIPHRWVVQKRNIPTWSMKIERRKTGFRPVSRKVLLPLRMYKEEEQKIARRTAPRLRAFGAALSPVQSMRNDRQTVGSEGVLSTIASSAGVGRKNLHVHPAADVVRRKKIRHFVVLTDFIGSGTRLTTVLDSLWRVRSIRSWWSGGLIKTSVLAYSGTGVGIQRVTEHPSRPTVKVLVPCPTVNGAFSGKTLAGIVELCERKAPAGTPAFGFHNVGALIAFEHSCPNNVPAIFTESSASRRKPWHALFPARSTQAVFGQLAGLTRRDRERLALETLGLLRIAQRAAFDRATEEARNMILALGSLHRGHRNLDEIATITFLKLPEVSAAIAKASKDGYLEGSYRLSASGLSLLRKLNQQGKNKPIGSIKPLYYPQSLRDPL